MPKIETVNCSKHGEWPLVESRILGKCCKSCYKQHMSKLTSEKVFNQEVTLNIDVGKGFDGSKVIALVEGLNEKGDKVQEVVDYDNSDPIELDPPNEGIKIMKMINKLFNTKTIKSKTFLVGLGQVVAGGYFYIKGNVEIGTLLVGLGLTAIVGMQRSSISYSLFLTGPSMTRRSPLG